MAWLAAVAVWVVRAVRHDLAVTAARLVRVEGGLVLLIVHCILNVGLLLLLLRVLPVDAVAGSTRRIKYKI